MALVFKENVLPVLKRWCNAGNRIALCTLINVDGSGPRPVGSQIGVNDNGDFIGMITGGCAERAIVAEAVRCISENTDKIIRYGDGSPYIDVVLPCGSGIDLMVCTSNVEDIVWRGCEHHDARKPFWLSSCAHQPALSVHTTEPNREDYFFLHQYDPDYRLLAFGEGANLISLATVAQGAGFSAEAFTPDRTTFDFLSSRGIKCQHISKKSLFSSIPFDPYTSVITLFHEHDWENDILYAALNSTASYIGALGSKKTHKKRVQKLKRAPRTSQPITAIHGPVGLDIGGQNPDEIAISILAHITQQRRLPSS